MKKGVVHIGVSAGIMIFNDKDEILMQKVNFYLFLHHSRIFYLPQVPGAL